MGGVPTFRGAERDQAEVDTWTRLQKHGRRGGREGVRRQQDGQEKEEREAGSPLTPGPQRCYQARPRPENPSWIPPHSSLSQAGFTASRCGRTLFMAAPFSSSCLQAPKASGRAEGGLWGQESPAQPPNPSFEPCWVPEGGGWVGATGPLPGSLLHVWGRRPTPRQGPPPKGH